MSHDQENEALKKALETAKRYGRTEYRIEQLLRVVMEWQKAEDRVTELEKTLLVYKHCRHACINCFCTKEARQVLAKGEGR